jgi:hypothetical protein
LIQKYPIMIYRQPETKGQFHVAAGIAKRQTAAEYLTELERIGILKPYKMGRATLYLNVDLYDLLSQLPKGLKGY